VEPLPADHADVREQLVSCFAAAGRFCKPIVAARPECLGPAPAFSSEALC
jgi:hypothetical protein